MYLWTRKIVLIFGIHTHPHRNNLETLNLNFAALFSVYLCKWPDPLPAAVWSYL